MHVAGAAATGPGQRLAGEASDRVCRMPPGALHAHPLPAASGPSPALGQPARFLLAVSPGTRATGVGISVGAPDVGSSMRGWQGECGRWRLRGLDRSLFAGSVVMWVIFFQVERVYFSV